MKKNLFTLLSAFLLTFCAYSKQDDATFVLVHGAWHGDWTWFKLEYELIKADYRVVNVNLPGHGIDTTSPGSVALPHYVNAIHQAIDTITNEVILVGHSMAGIAISSVAEAYPEKVDKLVYLAAFLIPNGSSMIEYALRDTLSMIPPNLIVDTVNMHIDLKRGGVEQIFYSESTLDYVILSEKLLTPEPLIPIVTPLALSDTAFGSVPRYYIHTAYDNAITPEMQEFMFTQLPCVEVFTLKSEHSPFFSKTVNLKNALDKIAKDKNTKPMTEITPEITMFNSHNNYNYEYNF